MVMHRLSPPPAFGWGRDTNGLLRSFPDRRPADGGWLITTHCLAPGGSHISVLVRPSAGGFLVTDDAATFEDLASSGLEPSGLGAQRAGKQIAGRVGIRFVEGAFTLGDVPPAALNAAIVHVANAAQEWARNVAAIQNRAAGRDLRRRLLATLRRTFGDEAVQLDQEVHGENKVHSIAATVRVSADLFTLIEPVSPHQNSISSAYMKFSDIGVAHPSWRREFAVEHVRDEWRADDLALLASVATAVIDLDSVSLDGIRRMVGAATSG